MKTLFTLLLTALSLFGFGQAPDIEWQKSLGGENHDYLYCLQQTKDLGYIACGYTFSGGGDVNGYHGGFGDYWVVKLNNAGNIEWQKALGGGGHDYAYSVEQTTDGGYIVAGSSESNNGDVSGNHGAADCWIVKLNNNGIIEWQKSFGGNSADVAKDIKQTTDGGYIVACYSQSEDGDVNVHHGSVVYFDYWIIKLSNTGVIEWQKSFGGSDEDYANSIQQTIDGGYIVAGSSYSNDYDVTGHYGATKISDYWIIKLTSTGVIEWEKSLGGTVDDFASSIKQTIDGGYIVAGTSYSNDNDVTGHHGSQDISDCWIVKLTVIGNIEWEKSLGGSNVDASESIVENDYGEYIIAGSSGSNDGDVSGNHGYLDYWVIDLNPLGYIKWQKSFGGYELDMAESIGVTLDGGYIIGGNSQSNNGDVSGNHGTDDYWVIKLKPETTLPITQLYFTANPQQNKTILLSWATANEINNSFFTIEKSKEAINFMTVGIVPANEKQETRNNYSFSDNIPFSGTSYYRLKQTDKDGKFIYSKVVPVDIIALAVMVIKPNPSHNGKFTIDLGEVKNNIRITVTDNNGRQVYMQQIISAQDITINLNKAKGVYFLQLSFDGGKDVGRLVVE